MGIERECRRWLGGLAAALLFAAPSVARADVPDVTLAPLRGRVVVVETQSGLLVTGRLVDVQATSLSVVLSTGESALVGRESVRTVSVAVYGRTPSEGIARREPPKEISPGVLEYREGDDIPLGYARQTRARRGLVIAGSVTFGVSWLASIVVGALAGAPAMAIPLGGPWVYAVPSFRGGSQVATIGIGLAVDGISQAVGAGLLIGGLAAPQTVLVRSSSLQAKTWWVPVPMSFGQGSMGIGMVGTL